jgi:hypothetical protein
MLLRPESRCSPGRCEPRQRIRLAFEVPFPGGTGITRGLGHPRADLPRGKTHEPSSHHGLLSRWRAGSSRPADGAGPAGGVAAAAGGRGVQLRQERTAAAHLRRSAAARGRRGRGPRVRGGGAQGPCPVHARRQRRRRTPRGAVLGGDRRRLRQCADAARHGDGRSRPGVRGQPARRALGLLRRALHQRAHRRVGRGMGGGLRWRPARPRST